MKREIHFWYRQDKQKSQLRVGLQMVDILHDLQSYFTSNYANNGDYKDNPAIGLMKPVNGNSYNDVAASINLRPSFGIWYPSFTASLTSNGLIWRRTMGNRSISQWLHSV